jgi:hypothetical protein
MPGNDAVEDQASERLRDLAGETVERVRPVLQEANQAAAVQGRHTSARSAPVPGPRWRNGGSWRRTPERSRCTSGRPSCRSASATLTGQPTPARMPSTPEDSRSGHLRNSASRKGNAGRRARGCDAYRRLALAGDARPLRRLGRRCVRPRGPPSPVAERSAVGPTPGPKLPAPCAGRCAPGLYQAFTLGGRQSVVPSCTRSSRGVAARPMSKPVSIGVPVPSGRERLRRSGPPRPGTDRPAGHGKADASLDPILTIRALPHLERIAAGQRDVVDRG